MIDYVQQMMDVMKRLITGIGAGAGAIYVIEDSAIVAAAFVVPVFIMLVCVYIIIEIMFTHLLRNNTTENEDRGELERNDIYRPSDPSFKYN